MLIHQEGWRSKKETEAIAGVNSKGGIEEYLSTTNSKKTKDLHEVFSLLEQPSDSQEDYAVYHISRRLTWCW